MPSGGAFHSRAVFRTSNKPLSTASRSSISIFLPLPHSRRRILGYWESVRYGGRLGVAFPAKQVAGPYRAFPGGEGHSPLTAVPPLFLPPNRPTRAFTTPAASRAARLPPPPRAALRKTAHHSRHCGDSPTQPTRGKRGSIT